MFLIPTRGRPESVRELISACYLYGMPDAAVMVGPPRADYDSVRWPKNWRIHYDTENAGMVAATNKLFALYPDLPWYGFLNDRARPAQEGWVEGLLAHVKGGWANQAPLNYKHDRPRMKNGIMDGDLVRKRGWFWPPWLVHLYVDDAMEDMLYDEGLFHQTDVQIIEQPMKKHLREVNGEPFAKRDHDAYMNWRAQTREPAC